MTFYERFTKGEWLMLNGEPAKYVGSSKAVVYREFQGCEFADIVKVAAHEEARVLDELPVPLSGFVAEVDYRIRNRLGEIGERLSSHILSDLSNLRFNGFHVKGIFPDFQSGVVESWYVLVENSEKISFEPFNMDGFNILMEDRVVDQPIKANDKPFTKGDLFVEINHCDGPQVQFVLDVLKVLGKHYVLLYNKETNKLDLRELHDRAGIAWKPYFVREATIEETNEFFKGLKCQLGSLKGEVAVVNDKMILVPDFGNPIEITESNRQILNLQPTA